MPKLSRQTQKIFAGNANNTGVFGSAADNTKILTQDIQEIQSKPAFLTGWINAVLGTRKYPALEEMQALQYMQTYQLAYMFENGIPEYDPGTNYFVYSVVRQTGTFQLYGSLTNDNLGNPLNDTDNWKPLINLDFNVLDATTSVKGIAMLATISDIISGNNDKIVTPNLLSQYGFQTGDVKATTNPVLQDGWVWAAGTIGNSSSGATRANSDTEHLFKMYWNATEYNYTGTTATGAALQVYDSSGNPVSKGLSADSDWNNNRRMSVVDLRDRVIAGRGNMVGTAGRLSGQMGGVNGNGLGNSGGWETHSLDESQNGEHRHTQIMLSATEDDNPDPPLNRSVIGNNIVGAVVTYSGGNTGTNTSGEGSPHNNVQPTMICNYVIKL